jgi:hypothetical protein
LTYLGLFNGAFFDENADNIVMKMFNLLKNLLSMVAEPDSANAKPLSNLKAAN